VPVDIIALKHYFLQNHGLIIVQVMFICGCDIGRTLVSYSFKMLPFRKPSPIHTIRSSGKEKLRQLTKAVKQK